MKQNHIKHFGISIALMLFMMIFALPLSVYASGIRGIRAISDIRIEVNDELLDIPEGEEPIIADGHIFAPLRLIAEELGLSVEWDTQIHMVSLETLDFTAHIQIGSNEMLINERTIPLDAPVQIVNGRTMMTLYDIAEITGMDVLWNGLINTIHILEPFPPIENWPEHLPEHVPGSITLRPLQQLHRHWSEPPMRFRQAFYGVPHNIIDLVDLEEIDAWWPMAEYYIRGDINQLMRFLQYFNISREDFDAAMEITRELRMEVGFDPTDERYELPNADIIFTFDNDLIRYFYRRQ